MDEIYRELFAICHRVLDPESPAARIATTVIHSHDQDPFPSLEELNKAPWAFRLRALRWSSAAFHGAMVQLGFGGFYPDIGQLERCAAPGFRLIDEVDGTEDYRITSDAWGEHVRRQLLSWRNGRHLWLQQLRYLGRHPFQGTALLVGLLLSESWQWQFRGTPPPTRLLRQVWQCESPVTDG
jgi:hypothetical protein